MSYLEKAWSDVRICTRCGKLSGDGKDICAICRLDDYINEILDESYIERRDG